ncbi:MAG: hypothetical protein JHC87_09210, partial [Thermoleophilaceae bacterium]|nr:hypothetical protein [Thermoleophilaceae bacterium]
IVFLDVGQGDSELLLGSDGCTALIDGGPSGSGLTGKLRALGVKRLNLVITTHPAADHHGGVIDLVRDGDIEVDRLLAGGLPTFDASYLKLIGDLRARGATFAEAVTGATWRCGDIAVDTLGPAKALAGARPAADANTRAAVTEVAVGDLTMLTSGDAESPQLLPLSIGKVDILKVPHHGSADAGLPSVLLRTQPSLAVIEVGKGNTYGHPTPEALAALQVVPQVKRTDLDGTVIVPAVGSRLVR